jgi:hypothetical protein|tara:strand:- start:250 stop:447 length:198 start_codon:yes stop_codon:yes gene_type:complete
MRYGSCGDTRLPNAETLLSDRVASSATLALLVAAPRSADAIPARQVGAALSAVAIAAVAARADPH